MQDLKTIFGQQIQLKWDRCLVRIKMLNIYFAPEMFSLNMDGLKKVVLNAVLEIINESNRKPNKLQVDQGREFQHTCERTVRQS